MYNAVRSVVFPARSFVLVWVITGGVSRTCREFGHFGLRRGDCGQISQSMLFERKLEFQSKQCGRSPQPLTGAALCLVSVYIGALLLVRNKYFSRVLVLREAASSGQDPRGCLPTATAYPLYPDTSRLKPRLNEPIASTATTLARWSTVQLTIIELQYVLPASSRYYEATDCSCASPRLDPI